MSKDNPFIDVLSYNQSSFLGGMNLLGDDTRLQPNQYRIGFNLTNRFDQLDLVLDSQIDVFLPKGNVQELVTFGQFVIAFVSGNAYYRYYTDTGWIQIQGFRMSPDAFRYWTVAVPVSTTNYVKIAATSTLNANISDSGKPVQLNNIAGANFGNLPGLLVQDNINQPQFIFISNTGVPTTRTTQDYKQWHITYTDGTNTVATDDAREYVPIGNVMTWDDGVLYITSQDFNAMYPSVSGRPLDFVRNVTNLLADGTTTPPFTQFGGGDATTTSYSVGVGGITCIRSMSSGGIFVSASNANFQVTKNTTPGAPTIFGEYTFIRKFLFNANCLSDRAIFDSLGDSRFIDITGVRSFNAVEQLQNEGRNSVFTQTIQSVFGSDVNPLIQDPRFAAGILYNNYELYAVNTLFGFFLAKYDTINSCWTSLDSQTHGKRIKILAKIELAVQRLYAVTEDNTLYTLYIGPNNATSLVRTVGICSNLLYVNSNIKMNNPEKEIKGCTVRCIVNNIKDNGKISFTPYFNNRLSSDGSVVKKITYRDAPNISKSPLDLPDVNSLLQNILWSFPKSEQGWKMFGLIAWDQGTITQFSVGLNDVTPMNPLLTQGVTV